MGDENVINIIIKLDTITTSIMIDIMIRSLWTASRACWQLGGHLLCGLEEVVSMLSWGSGTWEGRDGAGLRTLVFALPLVV